MAKSNLRKKSLYRQSVLSVENRISWAHVATRHVQKGSLKVSDLIFDETLHRYTLDGEVIPSVTQIIKPLYDFSMVPAGVLQRAAEFGTAVHKTVELYLKDDLDEDSLDEPLYNCLLAFKAFEADHYDLIEGNYEVETLHYHPKLKYAGIPDLDGWAVIDLKSRAYNPLTDPIQLAAYDHFGSGKRQRFVLELKQDASYVLTHANPTKKSSDLAWSRFRYLLDYYNMTNEIESGKL